MSMSPQEIKFKEFFFHEKVLVKDMDDLQLEAHREELQSIAFEARARLTAVHDEMDDRRKSKKVRIGVETTLQTDDETSELINKIKERQKKQTKLEKVIEGLVKIGISQEDAEKMVSATTQLELRNAKTVSMNDDNVVSYNKPANPFHNPFKPTEKKES